MRATTRPATVPARAALPALLLAAGCAAPGGSVPPPAVAATETGAPEPSEASYDAWRAYLLPRPADERWREIPWRVSYASGLADAAREGRPLLLWAMNGHPLGAT